MKKKLLIGLAISGLFVYLALRGIDFSALGRSLASAHYGYILPVLMIVLLAHYLRCYRWGIIMESLVRYDQKTLFVISTIGFMAIGMLPARIGEFARPYLVKQKSGIRMSSTMATVIVERIFDMLALMAVLLTVILRISLPPAIFRTGLATLLVALTAFVVLIFLAVKKEFSLAKLDALLGMLPERLAKPLKNLAHAFMEGLQILPDVKKTLYVAALSVLIWLVVALSAYVQFFAFDFGLPPINALAITVIIALGVMLPAAPGFLGTYHYACVLGLTSFGIAKAEALSYAITLHFLQMMPSVLLGLVFLPFQKISLPKFIQKETEEIEQEGFMK